MIKLRDDQKLVLEIKLKKAREASERNRLCVILGHDEGLTIDELAKVFRINRATVCNYLKDFNSKQKTKNDLGGGTKSKLTKEQAKLLSKHLTEATYLNFFYSSGRMMGK